MNTAMKDYPQTHPSKRALHLIPVGLGDSPLALWLPDAVQEIARNLTLYIAENAKSARAFLNQIETMRPIQEITLFTLRKKGQAEAEIIQWLKHPEGAQGIGLVSEAGCPAVADPGAAVVSAAHHMGIPVIPHVGPSSILLALMASGLNGQNFCFQGYLPIQKAQRQQAIKQLERQSAQYQSTQLFIETPYRNQELFATLCECLHPQTRLCVARSLTTAAQWIRTLTIEQWRARPAPKLDKQPAMFLLLAAPQERPARRTRHRNR